eukprot:TRINITY_DN19536_c0_g1_i1.p1 TRINITY_DN19536_c0_g1~~TRINITY_DN19536_c0_g1_i1.p1  ORF type:complete len:803 (+),score=185.26 TRINITY_DN19536_c0_g1_i1:53-2461(+)
MPHQEHSFGAPTRRSSPWRGHEIERERLVSPPRRKDDRMSNQTVELLFAQQSEMEDSLESRLCGTVNALRDEVRELELRLSRSEDRKYEPSTMQLEQAVQSALSLYADQSAEALSCLSDELLRPVNAPPIEPPSQHQPLCQNLRSSLTAFVSEIVTKQLTKMWDEPSAPVPQSSRKHISDVVRSFQESLNSLHEDIQELRESHPLAIRVAAIETNVAGKRAPDIDGDLQLKVTDIDRRYTDLSSRLDNLRDQVLAENDNEEGEAATKATEMQEAMRAHQEEVWAHISATEKTIEKMIQKTSAGRGDAKLTRDVGELQSEMLEVQDLVRQVRQMDRVKDEMRQLRSDVTLQINEATSSSIRQLQDANTRTREEVRDVIEDIKRDSVTHSEFLSGNRRTGEHLNRVTDALEDLETRIMDATIQQIDSSKTVTHGRLSQLEDDLSQLMTLSGDIKHIRADNEVTKEDLTTRITSLETSDRRREGNERILRRMETKQRDLEDKLTRLPTSEIIDRDIRRLTQDIDGKIQTLEAKIGAGTKNTNTQDIQDIREALSRKADHDDVAEVADGMGALEGRITKLESTPNDTGASEDEMRHITQAMEELQEDVRTTSNKVSAISTQHEALSQHSKQADANLAEELSIVRNALDATNDRINVAEAKLADSTSGPEALQMHEEQSRIRTDYQAVKTEIKGILEENTDIKAFVMRVNDAVKQLSGYVDQSVTAKDELLHDHENRIQCVESDLVLATNQMTNLVKISEALRSTSAETGPRSPMVGLLSETGRSPPFTFDKPHSRAPSRVSSGVLD